MKSAFARNAIVLGLLTAAGPFSIDTYLPALPTIAVDLQTSTAAVQASMISFFAAVSITQVIYGPLSDILGRRIPFYFGLGLFVLGSIGCALAPDIEILIAFRFLQGAGACAGMVIPRAIVRDLHTGPDAVRLMALIMLVFSVSPILAPLSGSALIAIGGWRSIFAAIALFGIVGIALVAFALQETLPVEKRVKASLRTTLGGYARLLRDRHYLGVVLVGGFGMSGFYAYLAGSSFVFIGYFGLTPTEYSLVFALNAVGFIGMAQSSSVLAKRFGFGRLVRAVSVVMATFAVGLFVLTLIGVDRLSVVVAMLFAVYACLGVLIPATAVLALEAHGSIAGMASALMGTIQMMGGVVIIAVVSVVSDGTSAPLVTAVAVCAVGSMIMSYLTIRTRDGYARPAG